MSVIAVYPGTFDPITNGHSDLVQRASLLFDKVIVAIAANPAKKPMFDLEQRVSMAQTVLSPVDNVEICGFSGLLVDFAAETGADVIVKGLRAVTDFEYEIQMAQMNRTLSGIVTLFVATKAEYGYLSSSLVKQVAGLGGSVDSLVPEPVARALKERLST